jgi:hypothetical protein
MAWIEPICMTYFRNFQKLFGYNTTDWQASATKARRQPTGPTRSRIQRTTQVTCGAEAGMRIHKINFSYYRKQ